MSVNLHFPYEMIVEILSGSSVQSLIRFKCVSKAWFSLISDPDDLPILHLNQAKINSNKSRKILLHSHVGSPTFQCIEYPTTSNFGESKFLSFEFDQITNPTNFSDRSRKVTRGRVIGSCNGLVCICIEKFDIDFFLWNPSTRECRMLQTNPNLSRWRFYMYGFGYDSSTQDYKVVVASANDAYTAIITSKTNRWRQIEANWPDEFMAYRCHYQNGNLYWLETYVLNNRMKYFIITFDLAKETFGVEMALPDVDESKDVYFNNLRVLGECQLCLQCEQSPKNDFEWFMGLVEEDEVMYLFRDGNKWDLVKSYDIYKERAPVRFNITNAYGRRHHAILCMETLISTN